MKKLSLILIIIFFTISCSSLKTNSTKRKVFKSKSLKANFVYIAPGEFYMGSSDSEPKESADNDETPSQLVKITNGFYIQETETTQGQWQKIMGNNPSAFKNCGENCPVESVSWQEIQEFIKKLNEKEKTNRYRLPTEAEWEFVARAGTKTYFSFGDCLSVRDANFNGDALPNCPKNNKGIGSPVKVASYPPNAWGVYDMHGNIFEFCNDWAGRKYSQEVIIDPKGIDSGDQKVLRGGSFLFNANRARSANRAASWNNAKGHNIGFRLVREINN